MGGESAYRGVLNGTPIALGLHDLWAQYEFLDPNILGCGDYWAFKSRYVETGGYEGKQIVGYTHVDELMDLVKPYTTVVSKKVLNLPEKIPKTRWIEPTAEQKKLFKLILKGAESSADPIIKVENTLERMLRLRQVVGGWMPEAHAVVKVIDGLECTVLETVLKPLAVNPKMNDLMEMIDDHFAGNKFIIWSTFVSEIEHIRDQLAAKYGPESVECYYGKTEMGARADIEDRYCRDPKLRFFIGNPTAAGLGLTLISGENDVMVYYSGTSAFIDRSQSEDRAHRIGQKNTVVVIDMVMEQSVDLLIQDAIARKMDISEFVKERLSDGSSAIDLLNKYHEEE
jgi:SNF2 family DNA or RNA helicase